MNVRTQRFVVYWLGYAQSGIDLRSIPSGTDVVNLFLLNLSEDADNGTTLSNRFFCSKGTDWNDVLSATHSLQQRGIKVCVSIISPNGELTWNSIRDPARFAKNVADLVNEWGLDGIDIDPEMSLNEQPVIPNENFISVVKELGKYFGPGSASGKLLSIVSYELPYDRKLLTQTIGLFDYVMLMGYFWTYEKMISQFDAYASITGNEKLLLGISTAAPTTPVSEISALAAWQPASGTKGGIMEYNINADTDLAYAATIISILNSKGKPVNPG